MKLRTVAIWMALSIAMIVAVGYGDLQWMLRTFLLVSLLWVGAYTFANWRDRKDKARNGPGQR